MTVKDLLSITENGTKVVISSDGILLNVSTLGQPIADGYVATWEIYGMHKVISIITSCNDCDLEIVVE